MRCAPPSALTPYFIHQQLPKHGRDTDQARRELGGSIGLGDVGSECQPVSLRSCRAMPALTSSHPLPILNVSDHCTRTRLTAPVSKGMCTLSSIPCCLFYGTRLALIARRAQQALTRSDRRPARNTSQPGLVDNQLLRAHPDCT